MEHYNSAAGTLLLVVEKGGAAARNTAKPQQGRSCWYCKGVCCDLEHCKTAAGRSGGWDSAAQTCDSPKGGRESRIERPQRGVKRVTVRKAAGSHASNVNSAAQTCDSPKGGRESQMYLDGRQGDVCG